MHLQCDRFIIAKKKFGNKWSQIAAAVGGGVTNEECCSRYTRKLKGVDASELTAEHAELLVSTTSAAQWTLEKVSSIELVVCEVQSYVNCVGQTPV